MNNNDLGLLLGGHVPIIAIETHDEEQALALIDQHKRPHFSCGWKWTITEGLEPLGFGLELKNPKDYSKPEDMLRYIKQQHGNQLYVLCDLHPFLDEPSVVRFLKDLAMQAEEKGHKVVLISHQLTLPPELKKLSVLVGLTLPSEQEVMAMVKEEARRWKERNRGARIKTDNESLNKLVNNLVGLPHQDVRRLAYGAIADDGAITESDLPSLTQAKFTLMDMDGVLHFEYSTEHLKNIAGFENLKQWLALREPLMQPSTQPDSALAAPKGVLIFGVQGGGKSLAAKSIAGQWGLPLLRLDFAALYNKYVGETERNLRDALKLADSMEPCVLWVDEIEKGLAEESDNATSKRVLGTLLTWMNERKTRVFLVATSNDISQMPPELMRKGRFDETFFVDLPDAETRHTIFSIHLTKRNLNEDDINIALLSELTEGFTGAEIEQVVVSAAYSAAAEECAVAHRHIEHAATNTQPLSVLHAEKLYALRDWADGRSVIV